MEALASHDDIRSALIATLRDRLDVARQHMHRTSSEGLHERFAVLSFGYDTSAGRETEELRRLYAHAGRLIEDLVHSLCPDCDGDPTHPGVVPCYDCQTVCVHDRGCQERA